MALGYLAARPDGGAAATWRLRVDLLRQTGRTADAAALVRISETRTDLAPIAPAPVVEPVVVEVVLDPPKGDA